MGKYDSIIENSKVFLTEASVNAYNIDKHNLKLRKCAEYLLEHLPSLEKKKNVKFFSKFKDAMFDTEDDAISDETAKEIANKTGQIKYCLKCKCANCPIIEDSCDCQGCLLGSCVESCSGGTSIETRKVDSLAPIMLNGEKIIKLELDRGTKKSTATTINYIGLERHYGLDMRTGQSFPLD